MTTPELNSPKPVIYHVARNFQRFLHDSLSNASASEQIEVWKVFTAMCYAHNISCEMGKKGAERGYTPFFLCDRASKTNSRIDIRNPDVGSFDKMPETFRIALNKNNAVIRKGMRDSGEEVEMEPIDSLLDMDRINSADFLSGYFGLVGKLETLSLRPEPKYTTILTLLRNRQ